jgi:NAD(P)-dependent dehydrogenase (short-subunit alcohol dehydrogenase family)
MTLKNKVAIVTGGNSGIGKAIVLELAKQGANVTVDYVSHPDAAEELEKQVAALGDRTIAVKCRREQDRRLATTDRRHCESLRPAGHYGEQRGHRDPHIVTRNERRAIREGA